MRLFTMVMKTQMIIVTVDPRSSVVQKLPKYFCNTIRMTFLQMRNGNSLTEGTSLRGWRKMGPKFTISSFVIRKIGT